MVGCLTFTFALAAMGGGPPSHDARAVHPVREAVASPAVADLLTGDSRRIRAMDSRTRHLLQEGVRRSRTFAALVTAIHRTDVIVYVQAMEALPSKIGGRLLLQAVTPHERYLRVQIRRSLRLNEAIEVMAHELQHALEVAGEPSVLDEAGLVALYRRIGYATSGEHWFDTLAARRTGEQVRVELRS